jgi:DNA-binding LacI/PurR family transcriptional regulator
MQDVADHAGVSLTTVSFVVNGTKRVAPATRTRVEEAMADLGYRRNVLARALASRRSHIVALVFIMVWARVAYPRLREDQLQRISWIVLVPLSLINLAVVTIAKVVS